MHKQPIDEISSRLHGDDPSDIARAARLLCDDLTRLDDRECRAAIEALCGLFYIDLFDRPDLQPAVDAAVDGLVAAGERVIPTLLRLMEGSDFKSHLHLARVLARIGGPSLRHLRNLAATAEEAYSRAFALYAIGKIADPVVNEALPEVVGSLMHPDREVRDSAARALGKMVESIPASSLTPRRRHEIYEALVIALADAQPAVRAKAARSLGKMARFAYLEAGQKEDLRARLLELLGRGTSDEWDHAYIVRREADEALELLAESRPAKA